MSEKTGYILATILIVVVLGCVIFLVNTPTSRSMINTYFHKVQEADDSTRYATKKKVEDTCRAMVSSYESDRLTYEQYKDSDNAEKQGWAEQAKMRANKTASSYNNYILENNYVWSGNVPADIKEKLDYIE